MEEYKAEIEQAIAAFDDKEALALINRALGNTKDKADLLYLKAVLEMRNGRLASARNCINADASLRKSERGVQICSMIDEIMAYRNTDLINP